MRRMRGTDLWYLVLELPAGSRVNYQLEVRRGDHVERINDPLNPKLSYSPVGTLLGLLRARLRDPGVDRARPRRPPGHARGARGAEPGAAARLPASRSTCRRASGRTATYPLLVVHDGRDFLQYAAAKTVLDNLIHRLDVAETVVAFLHPQDRLTEYADSTAHARFLTHELVPWLETRLPLVGTAVRPVPDGLQLRRRRLAVRGRAVTRAPTAR